MYKLLALDIDDTTLCHDGTLSEKNAFAIKEIIKAGGHVVIITGRSRKAAYPVWQMIPCDDVCVCFGGAVTCNMKTGKIISKTEIEPHLLQDLLQFAHRNGLVSQIYIDDDVVTEYENPYTSYYTTYLKLNPVYDGELRNKLIHGIPKMIVYSDPAKTEDTIALFKDRFSDAVEVSASNATLIEINNPASNKGGGLEMLCDSFGIDIKDSVAMGDSLLDKSMIEAAGIGVAVENAQEKVKEAADVIAPDCDSDAVYWVYERYFKA